VRLAFFSPMPPTRSGIADYAAELLEGVGRRHEIDVFVATTQEQGAWAATQGPFTVRSAHDFDWARVRTPYDMVVYKLGNARCHD
jgi:hypothetical protein